MDDGTRRVFLGLSALLVVWIVVFWATDPAADEGVSISRGETAVVATAGSPATASRERPRAPTTPHGERRGGSGASSRGGVGSDPGAGGPGAVELRGSGGGGGVIDPTRRSILDGLTRGTEDRRGGSPPVGGPTERASSEGDGEADQPGRDPASDRAEGERPPAPRAVVPPRFRDYEIRPGDTFGSIARREFGSARYASAIAKANPLKDPRRLRVGQAIRLPVDPDNVHGIPEERAESGPSEPRDETAGGASVVVEYVVQPGDTLSGISTTYYGTARHTDALYRFNRERMRSKDDLRVGQTLLVPSEPPGSGGAGDG